MNILLRTMLVGVVLSAVASPGAVDLAVSFRQISFAEATQAAAKEGKLVFIDFYTTWCEPCKRLNAETFTNAGVGKLVGDAAVPLQLDAEKGGLDPAKRYKVSAYPTQLLVKPDGTEVDRLVGFRAPAEFSLEFKKLLVMAQAGKSGLEEARAQVAGQARPDATGGDAEEAQPHLDLAKKLIVAGNHEEALKELLWCWDEGKKDPEFARMARSSQVPRELGRLARDYPAAREAMMVRRDQARERAVANKGGSVTVQDLIQLNKELKMDEDTIEVFDKMPEGDRRRVTISIYLFDVFLEKQRYADAMLFNMPESFTMNIERAKTQSRKGGDQAAPMVRYAITSTAKRVEALAGAGLLDQARELAERLLTLDASDETKELLRKHATRAGRPDLLKAM